MNHRNLLDETKEILIINKPLAKAIGLHQSIILRQLHYWLGRNTAQFIDGRYWIYNTYKGWHKDENFPFWTEKTINRHFLALEKIGLVVSTSEYNKAKYDNTKWYSIDYDKYDEIMEAYYKKNPQSPTEKPQDKMSRPSGQNVPLDQDKMSQPIPETTTKTTTETKELPSSDGVPKKPTTPFDELKESDKVLAIIDAWVEQRYAHNTPVAGKPHNNKTNKAGAKQLIALGLEPRHVKAYVKHLQDTDVWYEDHVVEFKKVIETCKLWVDSVLKEHAEKSASERPVVEPPPRQVITQWLDDGCTRQDMINMMCAVGVTQTQAETTLDDYGVSA